MLLQAPGVAQDSFGQIHLRGEHANVQYRLNGVELPEGLSVFGQALESTLCQQHVADHRRAAGAVRVPDRGRRRHPDQDRHHQSGPRGLHVWRQQDWLQPSFEYGGRSGPVDWFVTGDFLHNNRGIENPTSSFSAIHDTTNQFHGLAYVSGIIDPDTRISVILGGFDGQFQIPNNPGQPTLGFAVNGVSDFNSANLNENQRERTDFAIISLQKHVDDIDVQISAYTRYSCAELLARLAGRPAVQRHRAAGERAPTPRTACRRMGAGASTTSTRCASASWCSRRSTNGKTLSQVLPVDDTGTPTTDVPVEHRQQLQQDRRAVRASTCRTNGASCRR